MFLSWKKFGDLQRFSKLDKTGVFSQGCKLSPYKTNWPSLGLKILGASGSQLPRGVGKMISLTDAK